MFFSEPDIIQKQFIFIAIIFAKNTCLLSARSGIFPKLAIILCHRKHNCNLVAAAKWIAIIVEHLYIINDAQLLYNYIKVVKATKLVFVAHM